MTECHKPCFRASSDSVLFITLDSCRFDTFASAAAPHMKAVAPLHRAQAPSYYTYGSHSAMFVGFTPGIAEARQPVLNPKFGKLFRLAAAGWSSKTGEAYELQGRNIVEGFNKLGFCTIGTGAVGWFDPETPTGQHLTESFQHFYFARDGHSVQDQVSWTQSRILQSQSRAGGKVFAFLNIGETHVPYYFNGAPWQSTDNPCLPFQSLDRSEDCRARQRLCCEFVDGVVAPLLREFCNATILICGDHGDCWGEDGLWEHGISHPATLTVPLLVKVKGEPISYALSDTQCS